MPRSVSTWSYGYCTRRYVFLYPLLGVEKFCSSAQSAISGVTSGLVAGWSPRLRLHVKYYRRVGTTALSSPHPQTRIEFNSKFDISFSSLQCGDPNLHSCPQTVPCNIRATDLFDYRRVGNSSGHGPQLIHTSSVSDKIRSLAASSAGLLAYGTPNMTTFDIKTAWMPISSCASCT